MEFKVVDNRTWKQKAVDLKDKAKDKASEAWEWAKENKELVIPAIPAVIGAGAALIKGAQRRSNLRKQEKLKDLYCYDRSLGHYWKLRRELTNQEWLSIETRRKNGEKLGDILAELKVLD
jgi:hypothetical protein